MPNQIRTLGLYQPFATLMLYGKIETRFVPTGKKPPFPLGKYLIYSCKKAYDYDDALEMMGADEFIARAIFKTEYNLADSGTIRNAEFLLGHAIAIGDLVEIIDPILRTTEHTYVSYVAPCTRRRIGMRFENMKRIQPFPFKGKQGVGFLSKEDEAKIVYV